MIEHIVLLKFRETATAEAKSQLILRMKGLPRAVSGIVRLQLRDDILRTEDSFDLGMFVTLADRASLQRYGESRERQNLSTDARSLCDQVVLFDYETEEE